jgi:hypothetical protein
MSQEATIENISETEEYIPPKDKAEEHKERIQRTVIACFMGIVAGILSFLVIGDPSTEGAARSVLGILLLLAGIVFQKQVFMLARIEYTKLGLKDWFYQGFMTLALWFMCWTILLTTF